MSGHADPTPFLTKRYVSTDSLSAVVDTVGVQQVDMSLTVSGLSLSA
jgi:hypothetical protein